MKRMFTVIIAITVLLLSETVFAADIYAYTRETSQGAIFEYYVREESCQVIIADKLELQADIITVRKDKWGHNTPPLIVRYRFLNFDSNKPIFVKVYDKTGFETKQEFVHNDPIATAVFSVVKEVLFK